MAGQKKIKNIGKFLLKLIISGGALYFVFTKIDFKDVWMVLSTAKWYLVMLACLLFIFSKFVAALRLNLFFKSTEINLEEKANLRLYLLAMFYNLFLPGGIGGDGYKIYLLNKAYKVKMKKIFSAVLLDRISGMVALGILSILFFGIVDFEVCFYKPLSYLLIPPAIALYYFVIKKFFEQFTKIFSNIMIESFIVQISQTICAYFIMKSLGVEGNIIEYLLLFLISSVVAVIPFTIGGAGAREITFLFGAQLLGLDPNVSIAISLIFYLITLFVSFWGIVFVFKKVQLGENVASQ